MKKLNIRFEPDGSTDDIEIVIRASEQDDQVAELIGSLSGGSPSRLTVLDSYDRQSVIDESDILFASADGKQVKIVTAKEEYRVRQPLQNVEKLLGRSFLRVSRFEIVNLTKVRKYDFTMIGSLRIEFENGAETWASRRYIPLIRERISREASYLC